MSCELLEHQIKNTIKTMRKENALIFIIMEQVEDILNGDAMICSNCDDYKSCFDQ